MGIAHILINKNISEIEADSALILYNFQQLIIKEQKQRTLNHVNYHIYFDKKKQKYTGVPQNFKFTFYINKLGYFLVGSEYQAKQKTSQLNITIKNNKTTELNLN